ncbi:UNVERIFIED_CONTAM: hypothetical protein GTU68_054935, partial [Idotea baltica]|nr:hypothetical protein [Idotea baltica]
MNINFNEFFEHINSTHLKNFANDIDLTLKATLKDLERHGDWNQWINILKSLPELSASHFELDIDTPRIGQANDGSPQDVAQLKEQLLQLHPWRKGPFCVFDLLIDTEWRSDWKWQRLLPHISDLNDRYVLDVGCGNAYHSLRMQAAGAKCVIGIDPAAKFFIQYLAIK